jgi:TPR repeat protein
MRMVASVMLGAAGVVLVTLVVAGAPQAAPARDRTNVATTEVERLAKRGSSYYQTSLGTMYETGRGVPQDYRLAAQWYYRAAEQGNVRAQHLLGMLYDKGQGVTLDHVEAHKWLNLAASRASSADRDYFTRIRNAVASKLTRDQIYEAQRRAREWQARRAR